MKTNNLTKDVQIKLETVTVLVPTHLNGTLVTEAITSIRQAKTPEDLIAANIFLAKATTEFEKADKRIKEDMKALLQLEKEQKAQLKKIEDEVKTKAMELVTVKTSTKVNNKTGEIKETNDHNLPKYMFAYTPETITKKIDFAEAQELFKAAEIKQSMGEKLSGLEEVILNVKLFEKKVVYEFNAENMAQMPLIYKTKLPTKATVKAAAVKINKKAIVTKTDEFLAIMKEAENEN